MNTCKASYVVEVHSDNLVIVRDPVSGFVSCVGARQLWDALHGKRPADKPKPRFETVEEYLARGGTITPGKFPEPPKPKTPPEPPKPAIDYSGLSLADLGL